MTYTDFVGDVTAAVRAVTPWWPQELLRRRFEVWLKETGKQREINSLAACKERTTRYEKYKQLAAAAAAAGGGGESETPDSAR